MHACIQKISPEKFAKYVHQNSQNNFVSHASSTADLIFLLGSFFFSSYFVIIFGLESRSSQMDSLSGEAPILRASEPRTRAGRDTGAAVHNARRAKGRAYPELLQTRHCKLLVSAIEVRGRWNHDASPSEGPNHPSPSQSFCHQPLAPLVVSLNHARSYDSLRT